MLASKLKQAASFLSEYTYYVDAVNGSDTNNGKTPSTAYRTLAALPTLQTGDRIGLARGSHWREQLTISVDNVTVEAYGTGDKPLLDCSDVISNASFVKTAGLTNVYEVTLTPEWGDANELTAYEDDLYLKYVASTALCDAEAGTYYVSGVSGTITFYIHPFGSTNPATDGKTYEYAHRKHGVSSYDATGMSVRGIAARRNLHNGGAFRVGVNGQLVDCVVPQAGKYGILCRDGSAITNCTVLDTYGPMQTVTVGIHPYDPDPAGRGVTITGCTVSTTAAGGKRHGKDLTGITSHSQTGKDFGSITIRDCAISGLAFALISLRHTMAARIEGCTFTNCLYLLPAPSEAPVGATVLIEDCDWVSNVANQRALDVQYTAAAITIRNLRAIYQARSSQGYMYVRAATEVVVEDCTFHFAGPTDGTAVYCDNAGASLTLQRNAYTGTRNWTNLYRYTNVPTWTSDHNTFGPNFAMVIGANTYTDLAAYQTATGQDANSTVG